MCAIRLNEDVSEAFFKTAFNTLVNLYDVVALLGKFGHVFAPVVQNVDRETRIREAESV